MFDEPLDVCWRERFGEEPPAGLPSTLARFLSHRSVRAFAPRGVPETLVRGLVGAAQSAATSSNLQLYSLVSVQEPARRAAITKLCAGQDQVRDAQWFFAFLADHQRLRQAARAAGQDPAALDYLEFFAMAAIDAALAAERMTCAAEAHGLGTCYIGALRNDPDGVRELLELPEGVFGLFGFCLGYPADSSQAEIKPRLGQDIVWHRERYDSATGSGDYDARMRPGYEARGQRGDVTWSMRSGRRVSEQGIGSRTLLKAWLERAGFNRR